MYFQEWVQANRSAPVAWAASGLRALAQRGRGGPWPEPRDAAGRAGASQGCSMATAEADAYAVAVRSHHAGTVSLHSLLCSLCISAALCCMCVRTHHDLHARPFVSGLCNATLSNMPTAVRPIAIRDGSALAAASARNSRACCCSIPAPASSWLVRLRSSQAGCEGELAV